MMLVAFVLFVIFGVGIAGNVAFHMSATRRLEMALRGEGLSRSNPSSEKANLEMRGEWAGRTVEARLEARLSLLTIRVYGVLPDVSARPLRDGFVPRRSFEPLTMDAAFDAAVVVSEDSLEALVRLAPGVRARLASCARLGWCTEGGAAVMRLPWAGQDLPPLRTLRAHVEALAAEALAAPSRLAERIRLETCAPVRLRLLLLLSGLPVVEVARRLDLDVLRGADALTRALIVVLLRQGEVWDLTPPDLQEQVTRLLPRCVIELHRARGDEGALLKLIRVHMSADQREEPLVLAAVNALGAVGTRAAVPALTALIRRFALSDTLSRAATVAVVEIQDRIPGAERGQLEVLEVTGDGGAIALADPAGSVALAEAVGTGAMPPLDAAPAVNRFE